MRPVLRRTLAGAALVTSVITGACAASERSPDAGPSDTIATDDAGSDEPRSDGAGSDAPATADPAGDGTGTSADPAAAFRALTTERTVRDRTPAPVEIAGLSVVASADAEGFVLRTEGGDVDFVTGTNVGATVPGRWPGEVAVDRATWDRWLPQIAASGVHALRVYTVHRPDFYDALRDHNLANPDHPLYLVHGVWIPEERFFETGDLFDAEVLDRVRTDIDDAVAVVHGDAELPERPGYASGTYTSDVSPWLISWAFGVEMEPYATHDNDERNAGTSYSGRYVSSTPEASPTEVWLAEMLDRLAVRSAERGVSVPLTFSNWPSTDPLEHPDEASEHEVLVGIDANHLDASAWPAGYYASYHAYPYFPDFVRDEPGIADFELDGRVDNYAGYLDALRRHHAEAGLTTMILEFGVPSSLGSAHHGPLGRDQGGHSERRSMEIDAELLHVIHDVGATGAFHFAWTDEWFKRTWNTMDTELPADRRQLWQNALTNEAHFGLIAVEPVVESSPVEISDDPGLSVLVHHDAAELVLEVTGAAIRPDADVTVAFDVVDGGADGVPGDPTTPGGWDTALVHRAGELRAHVRASNDVNELWWGLASRVVRHDEAAVVEGSGVWNEQRLLVNRRRVTPSGVEHPVEWFELNPLPTGSDDPGDPDFDARSVWEWRDDTLVLRVPWAVVGMSDPSSRAALTFDADGTPIAAPTDAVGIAVVVDGELHETAGYTWEPWDAVRWTERPKDGVEVFLAAVAAVAG